MARPTVRERLIARLRADGIVPPGVEPEVRRLYVGRHQRSEGAWSWFAQWTEDGRWWDAGSQWPMEQVARAPFLDASMLHGQLSIDPLQDAAVMLLSCGHGTRADKRTRIGSKAFCRRCRTDCYVRQASETGLALVPDKETARWLLTFWGNREDVPDVKRCPVAVAGEDGAEAQCALYWRHADRRVVPVDVPHASAGGRLAPLVASGAAPLSAETIADVQQLEQGEGPE